VAAAALLLPRKENLTGARKESVSKMSCCVCRSGVEQSVSINPATISHSDEQLICNTETFLFKIYNNQLCVYFF
jgi:hypothetical protein